MTGVTKKANILALSTNATASILLAVLLALGVYVNVNRFVLGDTATPGYRVLSVDSTYWNVACTIVGTVVGLFAAVAFANQDDHLTRVELANDKGVKAMFLRPLTIKRGWDQILHLQFAPIRSLLIFLTIITALTSAATVALFGVRPVSNTIVNPEGSVPLADLNRTLFINGEGGAVFPAGIPSQNSQISPLSGFLYRAAYITGRKLRGDYSSYDLYNAYLPEQGSIGDTIYPTLNTGGIGLNVSSYLQYSGSPSEFDMPARYEFNKLNATVYGTHINVTCEDASSRYTLSQDYFSPFELDVSAVTVPNSSRTGGPRNITFTKTLDDDYALAIGSAISIDQDTGDPTHTLLIPGIGLTELFALECTYSGREYRARVSVSSPTSPLTMSEEISQGPLIGPVVKQSIANVTQRLLTGSSSQKGGNLAQGFIDADFNDDGGNSTGGGMLSAVQDVLGMVGEAYISLQRQQAERLNIDKSGGGSSPSSYDSELRLDVTIQRLGGGQFGWLAVLAVLLLGTLMGTVRSCLLSGMGRADFDAQDAVKLLGFVLRDTGIGEKTRVMQKDGVVVLGKADPGMGAIGVGEKGAAVG